MADGLLPTLKKTETSWFASILYPLTAAESLAVLASVSTIFWIFITLIPEYCLTLIGDAEMLGASLMGKLIALVSILPVVFLMPFAVFYWLQYLGRVLVSSAIGETIPPRSPDRNFDGFLNGLSPWFIWSVLGLAVGLLPLLFYGVSLNSVADGRPLVALALALLGLPYVVMALMMTFLHDNPLAATPWGVIGAIVRLGRSYGLLCLFTTAALAIGAGGFFIAFLLRANHFWSYLVVCLGCWIAALWLLLVLMRVFGTYYDRHKELLRWHRERPRWGILWRL
jgi:hypothetical protein